jgi:hypothetical protein
VADVGWFSWEEVDRISAGDGQAATAINFGWPCKEGPEYFIPPFFSEAPYCAGLAGADTTRGPWLAYGDGVGPDAFSSCPVGRSVGPLATVRAASPLPLGLGSGLFIADFVRGCAWIASERLPGGALSAAALTQVPADFPLIVDAAQGPDGLIHWLALASDDFAGPGALNVLRTGVVADIDVVPAPAPGALARLSARGSRTSLEPGGLSFTWDLDADGEFDDAGGPDVEVVVDDPFDVSVRATDLLDRSHDATTRVAVGTPPSIALASEPSDGFVAPGTQVRVSATVSDPDRDARASEAQWTVELRHCPNVCHVHPVLSGAGPEVVFSAESHGTLEDSYYRVLARVTDRAGLAGTAYLDARVDDALAGLQNDQQPGTSPGEPLAPLPPASGPNGVPSPAPKPFLRLLAPRRVLPAATLGGVQALRA